MNHITLTFALVEHMCLWTFNGCMIADTDSVDFQVIVELWLFSMTFMMP